MGTGNFSLELPGTRCAHGPVRGSVLKESDHGAEHFYEMSDDCVNYRRPANGVLIETRCYGVYLYVGEM